MISVERTNEDPIYAWEVHFDNGSDPYITEEREDAISEWVALCQHENKFDCQGTRERYSTAIEYYD